MTREEIIKVFEKMQDTFLEDTEFRDAVDGAIKFLYQSLPPSNLDEAAKEYNRNLTPFDQCDSRDIIRAFKSGAEWMAGQGVKARCVESSNPISDIPNQRLHLITLLYEENENTPYVVAGDYVEFTLRKEQ